MILRRLYDLANRPGEGLLDDIAFEEKSVPFVVEVAEDGKYLGILPRRGEKLIPARKRGGEPKRVPDKGKPLAVPRAHGNTATQGFACFFCDTLPRVLPLDGDDKSRRNRETFWRQIRQAAGETGDPALRAVLAFGGSTVEDASLAARIRADVEALKPNPGDRCTFAWQPDMGQTVVERGAIRAWYRKFYTAVVEKKQQSGPAGLCQITGELGPIPTSHPIKVGGIPGGLPAGVSLVSYDKAAFESYGLEGAANAAIGYAAADGYLRAVRALIENKLRDGPRTSMPIGDAVFLFWTREPADTSDVMALDNPTPEQIERLLRSAHAGVESHGADVNTFYLLALSGNAARAIVRGYLETTLPRARASLGEWFRDLEVADVRPDGAGQPTNLFSLKQLASATAMDERRATQAKNRKRGTADTKTRLMFAALRGDPLPDSVLAACVGRLRAEGRPGFRPARMALIKLELLRRKLQVSPTLDTSEKNPVYVFGRLLFVFEQIQRAALGKVNSTVTDKYFGGFSVAPALVVGRLYEGALAHLRKLRSEKPGLHSKLDKLLTEVSAKLKKEIDGQTHISFPTRPLTLPEQGLLALGYYHQKAKHFEEFASRKDTGQTKQSASSQEPG